MKRFFLNSSFFLTILIAIGFSQCKKEPKPLNVALYDKPVNVIQSYIQGKWKVQYGKGGFIGNWIQFYQNVFYEFGSGSRVKITNTGIAITDTTIEWNKEKGIFVEVDSIYTMKFYDKLGYPNVLVPSKIYNDTLILHDYSSDAMFYSLIRMN